MTPRDIIPSRALRGAVSVPGDKSISHRALIVSALAQGKSRILGLSSAADVQSTRTCLEAYGVRITVDAESHVVEGRGLHGLNAPTGELWCGNSGTSMRTLAGVAAGQPFLSVLRGDSSLEHRPMRRVADPLEEMGASVELSPESTAPMNVTGRRPLKPLAYVARVPSAQVKTAILFAGLFADGTTSIVEPVTTRDHTERMLGLVSKETPEGRRVDIRGGHTISAGELTVPGDVSSALFLAAAAALVPGSEIVLRRVGVNPGRLRGFEIAADLGMQWSIEHRSISAGEPVGDIVVRSSSLSGTLMIDGRDAASVIDEIPMLSVLAAVSGCGCSIRGARELRVKESDRIEALAANFRSMGVSVEEYEDGFAFEPKNDVLGTPITTFGDHRIAMAFAVAGLVVRGVQIDDPDCAAVSFPEFWTVLDGLQA